MSTHILIIDDDPASLEFLRYMLANAGHEIITADDGAAGLRAAQSRRPDLIISDAELPELNGCDLARKLKSDPSLAKIPLVAVTASAMPADRQRLLAAGFDGYLAKPIVPETLVSQIEAFLPAPSVVEPPAPRDNRQRFLADMAAEFSRMLPQRLESLRTATAAGDLPGLKRTAHKVLGSCIFLKETRLIEALRRLEKFAAAGDAEQIPPALHEVEEAAETLAHRVGDCRPGLPR